MRISFLGTGHGIPEPNKGCSSALIEVGDRRYIIDMGTNTAEKLITKGLRLEAINAIFITHMHGDHTNGFIQFIELCNWAFKDADPAIYFPEDVEQIKSAIGAWMLCNHQQMREFDFRGVSAGLIYDDGVIKITAYRTEHIAVSYAYLIECEGKRVLFTGDLSSRIGPDDFPTEVFEKPLDLAICDGAHFDSTRYFPIFDGNPNIKRLCISHYSEKYTPTVIALKNMFPELNPFLAKDGMEITL